MYRAAPKKTPAQAVARVSRTTMRSAIETSLCLDGTFEPEISSDAKRPTRRRRPPDFQSAPLRLGSERQQHVAGCAAEAWVAGVHEHQTARYDGPGSVE